MAEGVIYGRRMRSKNFIQGVQGPESKRLMGKNISPLHLHWLRERELKVNAVVLLKYELSRNSILSFVSRS